MVVDSVVEWVAVRAADLAVGLVAASAVDWAADLAAASAAGSVHTFHPHLEVLM